MVTRALPGKRGNPNLFKPRPYKDTDVNDVRMWLNRHLKWNKASKNDVFDAIQQAAHERIVSPVRHYLEALPQLEKDTAREFLETVLTQHFGLKEWGEHPETLIYSKIVFRKWLISAVARALQPGCKADHVLILEGAQGAGKSTAIRKWREDSECGKNSKFSHLDFQSWRCFDSKFHCAQVWTDRLKALWKFLLRFGIGNRRRNNCTIAGAPIGG
jgi:hypothetical protein